MKTRLLSIVLFLILGSGLNAQTATAPTVGDGTSGNPYQIATLENLYWITASDAVVPSPTQATRWSSHYIQTADIDASATSGWDGGAGWTPIGYLLFPYTNYTTTFAGSYNGQGHTISGLYVNRLSTSRLGLFGCTYGATMNNIGVTGVNISGWQGNSDGGLVGESHYSSISYCYSTGSVSGESGTGGLVGNNAYSEISNCNSTCNVYGGQGGSTGGLVGNNSNSTISNCYSTGSVSGMGDMGGLVGINTSSSTVSNCFCSGNVSGNSAEYVGGLIGDNYYSSTVINCYSTGSVNGRAKVGGLVGTNFSSSYVINCFSTGRVSGSYEIGGLVGRDGASMSNSFWDTQTSEQSYDQQGTGKTTTEMKTQSTFTDAGWDFDTIWQMVGYNYPTLRTNPDASLPVELVSFSARCVGKSIVLEWVTESEVDNLGFILERSVGADPDPPGAVGTDWQTLASYQTHDALKGQGNTSSRTEYSFTDANVEPGKEYFYRLSDVSTTGEITLYASLSITLDNLPETTVMENAYPNPFNPQTYIAYQLAEDTDVNITVFDMLGRQVKTLYAGQQSAGSYHVYWNATNESGLKATSGGYIIRMQTENTTQVQKVILVK